VQYAAILSGQIINRPAYIIADKIRRAVKLYALACGLTEP
jgi:hypothetical protein